MKPTESLSVKHNAMAREIQPSKTMALYDMEHLLNPLIVCMSVFGLYSPYLESSGRKCACRPSKLYSAFVFIILCGAIYNLVNDYKATIAVHMGPVLGMWVLGLVFYSLNLITALVLFVSCCRKDGLSALLKSWLFCQQVEEHSSNNNKSIIKVVYVSLVVIFVYLVLGCSVTVISALGPDQFSYDAKDTVFVILRIILETYHMAVWSLSAVLVFVLSFAICTEFKSFKEDFSSQISSDGIFNGDLTKFRRRHQLICLQVEKMDDVVSVIVGCGIFINTIQVLLGLYVAVWHPDISSDPNLKMVIGHWIISSVGVVFLFCLSGGLVNHMANAPLSYAYQIDTLDNTKMATELQIFLSRLNGENIGLTAMKMFVVDKSTIRTVCGMLMTYYLVLVQFQSADNSRCTNRLNITSQT